MLITDEVRAMVPPTGVNYGPDSPSGCPMMLENAFPGGTPMFVHQAYMDGVADEVTGDVDSPYGHWYRVDTYLVTTDSRGISSSFVYATKFEAEVAFGYVEAQYELWDQLASMEAAQAEEGDTYNT